MHCSTYPFRSYSLPKARNILGGIQGWRVASLKTVQDYGILDII